MSGLGIIAGGGELPIAVAQCAQEAGKQVFVVGLKGIADPAISRFTHAWVPLGQAGTMARVFRQNGCSEVLLAGKVSRPKWLDISFDAKALTKLPKVMAAAVKGDDALLRSFVEIIEGEGFRAVSVAEAAPGLLSPAGALGELKPSSGQLADIELAAKAVNALGALDIGQAAIVCDGLVLAVEAAEGTDATIGRIGELPEHLRGSRGKPRGVLYKARKPIQDGKTDLPVIGPETVRRAAAVFLAGIAVEAGGALIVGRKRVIEAADRAGMFLYGYSPPAPTSR